MHLKTKIIDTPAAKLFKIYLTQYFRRQWLLFTLFAMLVVINIVPFSNGNVDYLPITFLTVIIGLITLNFFRVYKNSTTQRSLSVKQFELRDDALFIYYKTDGKPLPVAQVLKVYSYKDYFLIYHGKNSYFYLPISAFKDDNDVLNFKNWAAKYF